jgi:outer membrane protein insertion porin family
MSRMWGLILIFAVGIAAVAQTVEFPLVVSGVRAEGNMTVAGKEIVDAVPFKKGDSIGEGDLRAASQAIFDLGYFSNVVPTVEEGGIVVFHVTENPVVKSITITGNVNEEPTEILGITLFRAPIMRTDKIRRLLRENGTRVDRVLNTASLKKGLQAVIDAYDDKGYALVGIGEVLPGVDLQIGIVEGHIAENVITGLVTVPESVAREIIALPTEGCVKKAAIQEVIGRLRASVYFSDVSLLPQEGATPDSVRLVWTLTERRLVDAPVEIAGIDLVGVASFPQEFARWTLGEIPSSPVDNYALLQVIQGLHDLYWRTGYSMVRYAVEGRDGGRLRLRVEEGVIGEVTLSGNAFTKSYVIEKVLALAEGEVLNRVRLGGANQRLMSLGYFKCVDIVPEWSGDRVKVSVAITEATGLGGLNGSLAYSPESGGLVGKLDLQYKNLLGTGQDLSLSYSRGLVGDTTATWDIGYSTVSYFRAFSRVGFDLYRRSEEKEVVASQASEPEDEPETETETFLTLGGQAQASYPWGIYSDLSLSYKHEMVRKVNEGTQEPLDSVTIGLSYDRVNNPRFPTRGSRRSASLEKAGGFAPGPEFATFRLVYASFTPVRLELPYLEDRDQVLAARAVLGWGVHVPASQRYDFGGSTTVRGAETSLVSRLCYGNFEYRVSLVEGLTATLFLDGGLDLGRPVLSKGKGSFGLELGIEAAGMYVRLDAAWLLGRTMSPVPTFTFGFSPMF